MHRISWILPSALALVLGAVLAAPAGAAMPDAWITTKTKLALLTTAGVSGMTINVDTVFGRVTLHGTVRSAVVQNGVVRLTGTVPTGAQRLEAAVVARAIPGRTRCPGRPPPGDRHALTGALCAPSAGGAWPGQQT